MNENLLVDKELEQNRLILYDIANIFKTNKGYQRILFIIFSIAVWSGSVMQVSYPSQKILPDYKCIPEGKLSSNFTHITSLPNFKIVKDQNCIKKYCYKNNNKEEANQKFSKIVIDYTTITNFVTAYDSFCDFDEFFTNLNTLIQTGRIIGSLFLSYIADKYGRKNPYFMHIYIMLFFYSFIFFIKSRAFFYLFVFFTGLNFHLYFLLMAIANEMMTIENFSIFSSLQGVIFSIGGVLCTIFMVMFFNFQTIYIFQLIATIILLYLSNIYIRETLAFSIKVNLFEQAINDIRYLDEKIESNIQKDATKNQQLKRILRFATDNKAEISSRKGTIGSDMQVSLERVVSFNNNRKPKRIPDIKDNGILGPFKIIFGGSGLIINFFIFLQLFITANMNYYGPLYNINLITENVYAGTTALFLGGSIGELICGYYMMYNKRIETMQIGYIILAISNFLLIFIPNGAFKIFIVLIVFLITSFVFVTTYIFTVESLEIEIKNSMLTLLSNGAALWLMILPYLVKIVPDIFYLFSGTCFISLFLIGTLKETYKKSEVDF
jgi:MFS family permease